MHAPRSKLTKLILTLAAAVLAFTLWPAIAQALDLTGTVVDEAGKPLPNACVDIWTAAPKVGRGYMCPSCYADCSKTALTDASGAFVVTEVSAKLKFNIVFVCPGFQPQEVESVDPAGAPMRVVMKARPADSDKGKQLIRGRVLDPDGNPVKAATLMVEGFYDAEKLGYPQYGPERGDSILLTDDKGEFVLPVVTGTDPLLMKVSAQNLAPKFFEPISYDKPHELKLDAGARVSGRLIKDGKPLSGIQIGIISHNRDSKMFGHIVTYTHGPVSDAPGARVTGAPGTFSFPNMPAEWDFDLYVYRESLGDLGVTPVVLVKTGKAGTAQDLGDIVVVEGQTILGKVALPEGATWPENARVTISPEIAWEVCPVPVAKDGTFSIRGVPGEKLDIAARVPGYSLSQESEFFRERKSVDGRSGATIEIGKRTDLILAYYKDGEAGPGMDQVRGRVLDAAGNPLKDVVIAAQSLPVGKEPGNDINFAWAIENGEVEDSISRSYRMKFPVTAADGTFSVALSKVRKSSIFFYHKEKGYCQLTDQAARAGGDVKLLPFCELTGTAHWGGGPSAELEVGVYQEVRLDGSPERENYRGIGLQEKVRPNEKGEFTLRNLLPGPAQVSRTSGKQYLESTSVTLSPTAPQHVSLGSKGAIITGKIALPPADQARADMSSGLVILHQKLEAPAAPEPPPGKELGEEFTQWYKEWRATPESQARSKKYERLIRAKITAEGTYTFDGVEPGEYQIFGRFDIKGADWGKYLATGSKNAVVVTEKDFNGSSVVNGPTLTTAVEGDHRRKIKEWKKGDDLTEFRLTLPDGRIFTNKDLQGKVTVLSFILASNRTEARFESRRQLRYVDMVPRKSLQWFNIAIDKPEPDTLKLWTSPWPTIVPTDSDTIQKVLITQGEMRTLAVGPDGKVLYTCPYCLDLRPMLDEIRPVLQKLDGAQAATQPPPAEGKSAGH